jgi:hypothetical protein
MTLIVELRPWGDRPQSEIIATRVRATSDGEYLMVGEPDGTENPIRPVLVRQILPHTGPRTAAEGTSLEQARQRHRLAYGHWTRDEDRRLQRLRGEGFCLDELSHDLGRSKGAVRDRLRKLKRDA